MKFTASAPSNIAFIKYWGKKDEVLKLPDNGSISMNLSGLQTITSVEFDKKYNEDEIIINGIKENLKENRALKHLDRIRKLAGIKIKAKVVTENNFPIGTGLSSSASGFAALTVAGAKAAGLNLSEKDLSILARQGSGSACRSIPDGFVEWLDGETNETSYAISLYPSIYWDIADIVAIVSDDKKDVGSTAGQKLVKSSPFFSVRKAGMKKKMLEIKKIFKEKNFTKLGKLIEKEALEMHAVMLTSTPPLIYWTPGTLKIMKLTKIWREEGLEVYFTINTGQDIHLICEKKNIEKIADKLKKIPEIKKTIINLPAFGARVIDKHLF